MDANQLFFYLRGFAENVATPTEAQWSALRTQILQTKPVEAQIIQVPMANPIQGLPAGDCTGCGGKS
jgi:hypothetical protein